MMKRKAARFSIGKLPLVKRTGYGLIAVGLICLISLSSTPELLIILLAISSYLLVAGDLVLVLLNKGLRSIQYFRLGNLTAHWLECGWYGQGRDWYQYRGCPQCNLEKVALH